MSETAEFPLPYDTTDAERDAAKNELAKHVQIVSTAERSITFVGTQIGQTGPVWHLQYTRLYKLPNGYLAAARDMHEGVKVTFNVQLAPGASCAGQLSDSPYWLLATMELMLSGTL